MTEFEKDDWILYPFRKEWKVATHKKYLFIRIDIRKIQKGSDYRSPVWRAKVSSWNLEDKKYRSINVHYKKLTKYKIPEIFNKLIKHDSEKEAIFNYLFEGKYGKI